MKKNTFSILLVAGIILVANAISRELFFRLDLTEDQQYTLSRATKDILKNLESPVTVKAYFTEGLPPQYAKVLQDFRDMLVEYSNVSKGMVDYEFVNPNKDPEVEKELNQLRIPPILFNVREKDQLIQKKGYMAAIIQLEEQKDVIPVIQSGLGMEYSLTTGIKKLSVTDKPSVGLIQGHGEPGFQDLAQAYQSLSILYNVENIDLSTETSIADRFRAVALVNPRDSIPAEHLAKLDDYLSRGGNLFIAYNAVDGDLQNASGTAHTTGLESWLKNKGLEIENSFVVDADCAPVTVQQRQGFFTFNTQVRFPFLPLIKNFPDHPITKGMEQVILPFVSPIRFLGDSLSTFVPLALTSAQSGIIKAPTYFDVTNKKWKDSDFPLSNLVVAGILERNSATAASGKIILVGDGDFAVGGQNRKVNEDNLNLFVNSIDWLSDDTGLIELRAKGVASRPIADEYLGEDNAGKRNFLKYLNFGLPILLIIIYGIFRSQRQRNLRIKRMQERYV